MIRHKTNRCSEKVVGKDSIHCFKVTQGLFMQPLFVLLEILYFHPQQIQQVCLLISFEYLPAVSSLLLASYFFVYFIL